MADFLATLNEQMGFWLLITGLLGLVVGSFLNVVIHRLPKMLEAEFRHECACLDLKEDDPQPDKPRYNLFLPRSACPLCGHMITALENIPVLSWIFLRGKCSQCHAPISIRYPVVELLTCGITIGLAWHFGASVMGIGAILLAWFLIALFFIDADTYLLPDDLTLSLMWLGLAFNIADTFAPLSDAVIGAMAGYLLLWSIYWLFKLATGKEGMGYGDFKLLAALGAWLGFKMLPVIILLSSVVGAVIGITMILLAKHGWGKPMPFGPYLAAAGLVALIWGNTLVQLYVGI